MRKLDVYSPATGELLESLEADTEETISQKSATAHEAQRNWKRVPLDERLDVVRRFRRGVAHGLGELARTMTLETGKPISQSKNELVAFLGRIDFFTQNAPEALEDRVVHETAGLREVVGREPHGVVACVSAWNYPYFVGGNVFVPALLAGNTVLYKPSELASMSGLRMQALWQKAGLPEGCFQAIIGAGDAGRSVLDTPVDAVFFTGSLATGRRIAEQVAPRLIPLQLELGGKDPAYVTEEVAVRETAAKVADGAFYNAGQSCCAVERVYVRSEIFDEFVEEMVRVAEALKPGDPLDPKTTLGPLAQREPHLVFLEGQLTDARNRGARVLTGGKRLPGAGAYFQPTVVVDVDHTMALMTEESFGPVIGVMKVSSDEEALERMMDTEYGLTAAVYTTSSERAQSILSELPVGSAYQNCCDRVSPRLPWSGRKHSGLGATLGLEGISAMTVPKAWHLTSA